MGARILIGRATARGLLPGAAPLEGLVSLDLAMLNRHGLIAGATGTGKTKTVQAIAEQLAAEGVPVFLADLKGDLSGLAVPGVASPAVTARAARVGVPWSPAAVPGVRFLSLTGARGTHLRGRCDSFGPLLLARVLSLNETQTGVLTVAFQQAKETGLTMPRLEDLRAVLSRLASGVDELPETISRASCGVVLRRLSELEHQGGAAFFGAPDMELADLLTPGRVSILELADVQDRPALFSAFLMYLLARLERELEEIGDLERPRLVFIFDEAHHLFRGAVKPLVAEVERVIRLVRSKGVGVLFVTQHPRDLPRGVLAQLGNRLAHALRAYTPEEERALKAAARSLPKSGRYDLLALLSGLAIGEAIVSGLDHEGVPTEPAPVLVIPPRSRMGPLTGAEWPPVAAAGPAAPVEATAAAEAIAAAEAAAEAAWQEPDPGEPPAWVQPVGTALWLASRLVLWTFAGAVLGGARSGVRALLSSKKPGATWHRGGR